MFGKPLFWVVTLVVSALAWKCPHATVSVVGFVGTLVSVGGLVYTSVCKGCCVGDCDK